MNVKSESDAYAPPCAAIEEAKKRCKAIMDRVETLTLSPSCKRTLFRLVQSEFLFLSRISTPSNDHNSNVKPSICTNIGHLEAVVHILQHPNIAVVSRVCKPIPSSVQNSDETNSSRLAHIDVVCTLDRTPVWIIVSDRNPKHISWDDQVSSRNKGLRVKIHQLLYTARLSTALKPTSIIFFFASGIDDSIREKFQDEFGATISGIDLLRFNVEFSEEPGGEWVDIIARSYEQASVLEIKVDCPGNVSPPSIENGTENSLLHSARLSDSIEGTDVKLIGSFSSLISKMKELDSQSDLPSESSLINFDTTALIAIISGISNGNTEKLLSTPEDELKSRFKGNFEFVIAQVMSEIQNPIHNELVDIISGKRGIICESVYNEFKELVSMCGGPNEKLRAEFLLKHLAVVPDNPSLRMRSLPTTRKLALKNKIVFGTGDYWHAPTLTANMAFVRAISQTGMSLFTIAHRPRALTGD